VRGHRRRWTRDHDHLARCRGVPEARSGDDSDQRGDIEDDEKKKAEIAFMDAFAERVRTEGIEAAWAPILPHLAPIIGTLVREAIPRSDPASIAAAAAIGRHRSFRSVEELAVIAAPTLIIPGMDERHPRALAETLARLLPNGRLADVALSDDLKTAEGLWESVRAGAPRLHH
jgi:3-oxoadipate enol-lactonase